MEVLWLNDNKLTAINGLDNNIRIRQLYAHVGGAHTAMLSSSVPRPSSGAAFTFPQYLMCA